MAAVPEKIAAFLAGKCLAVAGVSRNPQQPANAIFKKLRGSGYDVFAINPNADAVEGEVCYPNLALVPEKPDGVVIATHPKISSEIVRQCGEAGIKNVWFHRSFGEGSVSAEALEACRQWDLDPIVGGCPMMFCEPVDIAHKCMRWFLRNKING
ncbi:MAG TPA: CoA-binding protein [Calditrichia bacterium]|nr:CoA-binding protein [Calditrichota bacterium]HQU72713.1 CoA-binding protein [Calditrichia bacterium]HQV31152.1 CoA-binding protein [Calditrichia bacterium]